MSVFVLKFHVLKSDLVLQKGKSVRFDSMKVLAKICKHAFPDFPPIFALAFRDIQYGLAQPLTTRTIGQLVLLFSTRNSTINKPKRPVHTA